MNLYLKKAAFFPLIFLFPAVILAQGVNTNGSSTTAPSTAVPFLLISPDSRSGALGDAGVALSPDVNANYWNPAKLAFLENNDDVSISYSPWLRQLVPDISLSYLSYAHTFSNRDAFGLSLRYFNYGSTALTDNQSNYLGTYYPNEYSINASYARKFGDGLSLGFTAGYIHSNFSAAGSVTNGSSTQAASNAVAVGVSLYYKSQFQQFGKDASFSFGTNISNLGTKISYSNNGNKYFLPANLKIGIANTVNLDDYNKLTFALDLNKVLVPQGQNAADSVSVVSGLFKSFSDGGNQFQQITISPALEYWYNDVFALRAGYFYESANYGDARYLTFGAGFKYDIFKFDFSYLAASQQNSPLANTLRFTLTANFGSQKK